MRETQLEYGNWIRKRNLWILGLCAAGTAILSLMPIRRVFRLLAGILFAVTFISFLFPLYTYVMASQNGGRVQEKVYDLIIRLLGSPIGGRLLDIGAGNGVLAVKLAQYNPESEVLGIDLWGKDWEYSREVCDKNTQIGGVEDRVHFRKGNAAELEFADDTFDGVVSNLTFHEVRSVSDKRDVVDEALRVVKPGGRFAFVDYFFNAKLYGPAAEFEEYLRSLNLTHFEISPLSPELELPLLLRHPKILGQAGIVYGQK
jgi:SAM-dependent methyltransferase